MENALEAFDQVCSRASVAAMEGQWTNNPDTVSLVRSILAELPSMDSSNGGSSLAAAYRDSKNLEGDQLHAQSLKSYVEATALLTKPSFQTSAKFKFEEITRNDPHFVYAHLGLATALYFKGEYRQAFAQYKIVLETLGSSAPPIVRVGLGLCSFRLQKYDHSRKCFERALAVNPDDCLALLGVTATYLRLRLIPLAVDMITRLYRLSPSNVVVIQRFVDVLYMKSVAAKRTVEEATVMLPLIREAAAAANGNAQQLAYAAFQEARLLHASNDLDDAKLLYEKALEGLPQLDAAKINLAKLAYTQGNETQCIKWLTAVKVDRDVLQLLCVILWKQGRHEQAMRYAGRLAEIVAQGDPNSWALAACCNRLHRDRAAAYENHAARMLQQLGQPLDWTTKSNVAALNNEEKSMLEAVQEALGTNDAKEIISLFESKEDIPLHQLPLLMNYAAFLEGRDADREHAKVIYILILKAHPGFTHVFFRLYNLAVKTGRKEEALSWMNLLQATQPGNSRSYVGIAALYHTGGSSENEKVCEKNALSVLKHNQEVRRTVPTALAQALLLLKEAQRPTAVMGHIHGALDKFLFVLSIDPTNIIAAHGVACCTAFQGRVNQASVFFEHVLATQGNSKQVQERADVHLFNTLVKQSSCRRAISLHEERISNVNKYSQLTMTGLAFCYCIEGHYAKAIKLFEDRCTQLQGRNEEITAALAYNMTAVYLASICHTLSQKKTITEGEGAELHQHLKRGLAMSDICEKAIESSKKSGDGNRKVVASNLKYLRNFGRKLRSEIPSRVSKSSKESQLSAQQAAKWMDVAVEHRRRKEEEEEQRKREEEEQRRMMQERSNAQHQRLQELLQMWARGPEAGGGGYEELMAGHAEDELGMDEMNGRIRSREEMEDDLLPEELEDQPGDGHRQVPYATEANEAMNIEDIDEAELLATLQGDHGDLPPDTPPVEVADEDDQMATLVVDMATQQQPPHSALMPGDVVQASFGVETGETVEESKETGEDRKE